MTFTFKRQQETLATYSIFGKLPCRADFIRINASHPAASALDELLANSMALLASQNSLDRYRSMPASFFMLQTQDQQWLSLGALQPSTDQSGRHYPLVAAMHLPVLQDMPTIAIMLLSCELFFSGLREQLNSALDNAVEMLACRQYLEAQVAFGATSKEDITLAAQLLEHYMRNTRSNALARLCAADLPGGLEAMLMAFIFHSRLIHKFKDSLAAQTYLLPLPNQDGEDMLVAATWLSLYAAATEQYASSSMQCLLIRRPEGRFLALQLSPPDAHIIAHCWGEPLASRFVVNTDEDTAPWRQHQSYAEASYILGKRMNDPDFTIAQLRDLIAGLANGMN